MNISARNLTGRKARTLLCRMAGTSSRAGSLVFVSTSAEETRAAGKALSACLGKGDIVYLMGQLGSGKTTFVQGLLSGYGIKGPVRSSSFMLVNEYEARDRTVYHMDLYRLAGAEMEDLGIEEYLFGDGVCLVEWGEKIAVASRGRSWEVRLSWVDENTRKIEVKRCRR